MSANFPSLISPLSVKFKDLAALYEDTFAKSINEAFVIFLIFLTPWSIGSNEPANGPVVKYAAPSFLIQSKPNNLKLSIVECFPSNASVTIINLSGPTIL